MIKGLNRSSPILPAVFHRSRVSLPGLAMAAILALAASAATITSHAAEVDPFFRDGFAQTSGRIVEAFAITSSVDLGDFFHLLRLTLPDVSGLPLPANTRLSLRAGLVVEGVDTGGSHMRVSFRLRRKGVAGTQALRHGNDRLSSTGGRVSESVDVPKGLVPGDAIEVLVRFTSDVRLRRGNLLNFSAEWSIATKDPDFVRNELVVDDAASLLAESTAIGGSVQADMEPRRRGSFAGFRRVLRSPVPALPEGIAFQKLQVTVDVGNFTEGEVRVLATVVRRPAGGPRQVLGKYLLKPGRFSSLRELRDFDVPADLGAGDEIEFQFRVRSGSSSSPFASFGLGGDWAVSDGLPEVLRVRP